MSLVQALILLVYTIMVGSCSLGYSSSGNLVVDPVRTTIIALAILLAMILQLAIRKMSHEDITISRLFHFDFLFISIFGVIFAPILAKDTYVLFKQWRVCEKAIVSPRNKVNKVNCNFSGPVN